jgi:hypothetical protein
MNHFTPQIDTRARRGGPLDRPFVSSLMRQAWDEARDEVDGTLAAQLYGALSAALDRLEPDGRELAAEFVRAYRTDHGLDTASTRVHVLAPDLYRQCSACYGSGWTACGSCGGMGGRYESRVSYEYDYDPVHNDEWVSCFCSGGSVVCGSCGGSGSVAR